MSNTNRIIRTAQAPHSQEQQLTGEYVEKYRDGKHFYHLQYIPSGQRDYAINAVGFYLWREGYGRGHEEKRLELLHKWFFDRKETRSESQRKNWEGALYRAVHWESKTKKPQELSEDFLDRLVAKRTMTPKTCKLANLKRENEARAKIMEAVAILEAKGKYVGVRAIRRLTKCHQDTIDRHKDLWQVEHKEPLSSVTGVITKVYGCARNKEQKKVSANQNSDRGDDREDDQAPLPPHRTPSPKPSDPKRPNQSAPSQTKEQFQKLKLGAEPPPPDLKEKLRRFPNRFSLGAKINEPQRERPKVVFEAANEDWFRENSQFIPRRRRFP